MRDKMVKGSIEYVGINTDIPDNINIFTLFNLTTPGILKNKEGLIVQIVQVISRINILEYTISDTPEGQSVNGKRLTGKQLIVEGACESKIQYISKGQKERKLETTSITTPFYEHIIIPKRCTTTEFIDITSHIDDISISNSSSGLLMNVSGMLIANVK